MSQVIQLSEQVYYLPGAVNCALVVNEKDCLLVDTGQDKDDGRAIRKACEELGVRPVAIINTHSHADHYGGNDYLLRQFDVPVYAPSFEAAILQNPYLEPVYLFSGAKPLPELRSKWLLAKPSRVDHQLEPGAMTIAGIQLELLDTSGHAHQHVSVLVDGVLLAADALFGQRVLERYPLPFGQDIGKQMASAKKLLTTNVSTILPGHGEPGHDRQSLVENNLAAFERAAKAIEQACTGLSTEQVLKQSCEALNVTIHDLPRYYLNLCVVTAYLSYLRETGRISLELRENQVIWSTEVGE